MSTSVEIIAKEAEIAEVKQAIKNGFLLGTKYKVESAKSNREFEGFSLADMTKYLTRLEAQLKTLNGIGGMQVIY